jgi:hypothetical protein
MQCGYKMTEDVDREVSAQPDGLRAKIMAYLDILKMKGITFVCRMRTKLKGIKISTN